MQDEGASIKSNQIHQIFLELFDQGTHVKVMTQGLHASWMPYSDTDCFRGVPLPLKRGQKYHVNNGHLTLLSNEPPYQPHPGALINIEPYSTATSDKPLSTPSQSTSDPSSPPANISPPPTSSIVNPPMPFQPPTTSGITLEQFLNLTKFSPSDFVHLMSHNPALWQDYLAFLRHFQQSTHSHNAQSAISTTAPSAMSVPQTSSQNTNAPLNGGRPNLSSASSNSVIEPLPAKATCHSPHNHIKPSGSPPPTSNRETAPPSHAETPQQPPFRPFKTVPSSKPQCPSPQEENQQQSSWMPLTPSSATSTSSGNSSPSSPSDASSNDARHTLHHKKRYLAKYNAKKN